MEIVTRPRVPPETRPNGYTWTSTSPRHPIRLTAEPTDFAILKRPGRGIGCPTPRRLWFADFPSSALFLPRTRRLHFLLELLRLLLVFLLQLLRLLLVLLLHLLLPVFVGVLLR